MLNNNVYLYSNACEDALKTQKNDKNFQGSQDYLKMTGRRVAVSNRSSKAFPVILL